MTICPSSPHTTRLRQSQGGFSLTEVIVALGLVMATALPTLGVLSMGLGDARIAATQHSIEALRGTIRSHLQSPSWPTPASGAWQQSRYFDSLGAETPSRNHMASTVEVKMTSGVGLGFDSPALESVRVEFLSVPSGEPQGSCLVQRVRTDRLVP